MSCNSEDALSPEPLKAAFQSTLDAHRRNSDTNIAERREAVQSELEAMSQLSMFTNVDNHTDCVHRLAVRAAGAALWDRVNVKQQCTFAGMQGACLALQFVPGMPSTLVWLEGQSRIHVADARGHTRAHQIVHAHMVPMQVALAKREQAQPAAQATAASSARDARAAAASAAELESIARGRRRSRMQQADPDSAELVRGKRYHSEQTLQMRRKTLKSGEQKEPVAIPLRQGIELVLRAWWVCNMRESHLLYSEKLRYPAAFPTYAPLKAALWGPHLLANGTGGQRAASTLPTELETFVHDVLRLEGKRMAQPSVDQEEDVTVRP